LETIPPVKTEVGDLSKNHTGTCLCRGRIRKPARNLVLLIDYNIFTKLHLAVPDTPYMIFRRVEKKHSKHFKLKSGKKK